MTRRRWHAAAALTAVWLLLAAPPAPGQTTGSLTGRVVDDDGVPVPGATVTALHLPTGRQWATSTDYDGAFCIVGLPSGPYRVEAALENFSPESTEVTVGLAGTQSVELRLSAVIVEDIVVTSSDPSGSGGDRLGTPSWNSWLEVRGAEGEPVERLEVGESYDFYLDLAPLAYELVGVASAETGPGLIDELRRALAAKKAVLYARVWPVPAGRVVRLLGDRLEAETWRRGEWSPVGGDGMVPMEIRLANLLAGDEPPAPREGPGWRRAADLARAGGLRFPVQAIAPGCGAITLSIWSEDGHVPLDHVVHTVTVGAADCRPAAGGDALRVGFLTLLHGTAGVATQAALHLFEIEPGASTPEQTVAVYVPESPVDGCEHFAWVRGGSLSGYLFGQPGFRTTLKRARDGKEAHYADLGRQLRRRIFPRRDSRPCGGVAALEALRRLASQPGRSLYVRVVDAYSRTLFVPLGLLFTLEEDAAGGGRVFASPPLLRQPLPVESYGETDRCVGSWYYLLPPRLHDYNAAIAPPAGVAGPALLQNLDGLQELVDEWWLAGPEPEAPAVGLVILAHHGGGDLNTDDPDEIWPASELGAYWDGRWEGARFPRGSVALLSACATGDPLKSRELVIALADAGFDTVILSPFDVHTPFGVYLATSFSRRVAAAMATPDRPRIVDLLAAALDDAVDGVVADKLGQETLFLDPDARTRARAEYTEHYKDMALEFLVAGHGEPRLCAGGEQER